MILVYLANAKYLNIYFGISNKLFNFVLILLIKMLLSLLKLLIFYCNTKFLYLHHLLLTLGEMYYKIFLFLLTYTNNYIEF